MPAKRLKIEDTEIITLPARASWGQRRVEVTLAIGPLEYTAVTPWTDSRVTGSPADRDQLQADMEAEALVHLQEAVDELYPLIHEEVANDLGKDTKAQAR